MGADLFNELEERIDSILRSLSDLKLENSRLRQENERLREERGDFKTRLDAILNRLERV